MRSVRWLLLLGFLGGTATVSAGVPVGVIGGPDHLAIAGAKTFSARQIKDALSLSLALQAAAERGVPRDQYLRMVEQLVWAGYRKAGFPKVQVSVGTEAGAHAVTVNVKEGPRYLAGEICVRGSRTIPRAQLVQRLTKPHPPRDAIADSWTEQNGETRVWWVDREGNSVAPSDAVWSPGKPAPFLTEAEADSDLHRDVADALADLGYFFTRFSVDVAVDAATKKARLAIDIAEEGTLSVLGGVNVAGNEKNSREAILKCVAFRSGVPATRDEQVRLQERLWRSGRFIKSEVMLMRPATAHDNAGAWINVVELHGASPLDQPLTRAEDLLLKCRDWLARMERWDGDLVVRIADSGVSETIVVSPPHGLLVAAKQEQAATHATAEYAAVVSPEEIGIYSPSSGRRFTLRPPHGRLVGSMALWLDENANNKERASGRLGLGAAVAPECSQAAARLDLIMMPEPVLFMDTAHRQGAKYAEREGKWIMSTRDETLRLDAASGKMLDYRVPMPEENDAKKNQPAGQKTAAERPGGDSGNAMRFLFLADEFRRRVDALHAVTAKAPNAYDSRRPVSSLLTFACNEECVWQWFGVADNAGARRAVRRLLDGKVCEPFDRQMSRFLAEVARRSDDDDFVIPDPGGLQAATERETARWNGYAWVITQSLFGPSSWPATVSRNALMMRVGLGEPALIGFKKIYDSKESGPVCLLTAGALLENSNPPLARLVLSRGLERLSVADFRKEYPLLLDRHYPLGQCARRMVTLLRKGDDRDVQAIAALLPEKSATAFRQWAREVRRDSRQPVEQAMPALLDALWQNGLCDSIKVLLEAWQYCSAASIQQRTPDQTIADATQAIAIDGSAVEMYKIRASAYVAKGEYGKVIADCTEVLRLQPNDVWARSTRGGGSPPKKSPRRGNRRFRNSIASQPMSLSRACVGGKATGRCGGREVRLLGGRCGIAG